MQTRSAETRRRRGSPLQATRGAKKPEGEHPLVSIVLAVRNEMQVLGRCLEALAGQDYPAQRLELIVADGESTDGTSEMLQTFAGGASFPVCIVPNPKRSAAAGFNACLRVARGEAIIVLGARAVPAPTFVSRSVEALELSGADGVGGVVTAEAAGTSSAAIALALQSPFGAGGARYRSGGRPGNVDTVNYGCYRRAVFIRAGEFDETMDNVEDDEFNYRLRAHGMRLFLSPDIQSVYQLRPGLAALARQFARYGYPKVRVLLRHPRQMQPRQFAPAALVCALGLGLAGYRISAGARRLFWLVAAAYMTGTAVASLSISRRHGMRFLPFLPSTFAVMHLSYGMASLAGVVRFAVLPLIHAKSHPGSLMPADSGDATNGQK